VAVVPVCLRLSSVPSAPVNFKKSASLSTVVFAGTLEYFISIFVPFVERSRFLIVTFSVVVNVPLNSGVSGTSVLFTFFVFCLKFFSFSVLAFTVTSLFPGVALASAIVASLIAADKSAPPNLLSSSVSFFDSFNVILSFGMVIALPVY